VISGLRGTGGFGLGIHDSLDGLKYVLAHTGIEGLNIEFNDGGVACRAWGASEGRLDKVGCHAVRRDMAA